MRSQAKARHDENRGLQSKENRFCPFNHGNLYSNGMKLDVIQIDKAGRIALPKWLREQLSLRPADRLRLSVEGNSIRLEPAELARKGTVLVFTGEFAKPITTREVRETIARDRRHRFASLREKARKK
jgi:AbrB family looped-hinge helix DNA binding protein